MPCDCGDASGRRLRWLVLRDPNDRASRAAAVVCRRDAPVGDVQRAVSPGREAAWEVQAADHHNRVAALLGDADDRAGPGSRVVQSRTFTDFDGLSTTGLGEFELQVFDLPYPCAGPVRLLEAT